jgi:SAM-dependent methyltransferase
MARTWQAQWIDRYYRSRPGWIDGTTEFHELCRSLSPRNARILEVGAGPTNRTSAFLASLGELDGLDVSEEVRGNAHLKSSFVLDGDRFPLADASYDFVVSDYVVEHVVDPAAHLEQIKRVLRPGGRYAFRTPNRFHYVAIAAQLTPFSIHAWLANRLRGLPADAHDPYPTAYAMNTRKDVRRFASRAALSVERIDMVEKEPSYGMFARPAFLVFMAYERLVNSSESLASLRANLFVVLRKPT